MNISILRLIVSAAPGLLAFAPARAADIAVVTPVEAAPAERVAARELTAVLQTLFPRERFIPGAALPERGKAILVGSMSHALVRRHSGGDSAGAPESYVLRQASDGPREIGVIAGADPRGTVYGVYALLGKLGCNFHLSGDALPPPRTTSFDFDAWAGGDRPLVRDRLVFNWHNFLSGCSTWNLADWQRWTAQSQKMGYNAIMVHAYGNNPMAGFTFDGASKPVGYLSTTSRGRDWSTMHVTDVRRIFGGEVFSGPVFGAEAGLAPEAERVVAAQTLMRAVFADAAERAMGVVFAVDVDTPSANPPELVERLPVSARFQVNSSASTVSGSSAARIWVPNPDTPEGYAYYRAQVAGLMRCYPQITRLVVWFRRGGTPWMEVQPADLPPAWQREFAAEIARTPAAEKYWRAAGLFAVGKIVRAFERALQEGGAGGTELAAGTWGFEFIAAADRFFPAGVALLGLDYDILHGRPQLGTPESRAPLREVAVRRPVIPIVWAHHDDGHYLGRPYTPLPDFATKLADTRAAGFGIIHWTTRPLDLFFSNLAAQVWSGTKDQTLAATGRALAGPWFGEQNRELLGGYLESWMNDAPRFGRETSDWFIDRKLGPIPEFVAGGRARLAQLGAASTAGLTPEQRARLEYYRGLEEWMAAFHEGQGKFQESQDRFARGDQAAAREALRGFDPGALIAQYARCSAQGGITRGEQGVVVTQNTRWLSHVVRHRQALGLEAVRIRFAPTSHDLLAQSRGTFTFHFDGERALWECWGRQEIGREVTVLPPTTTIVRGDVPAAWEDLGRSGVALSRSLTLALRPIMAIDSRKKAKPVALPTGAYRLRLLFLAPTPDEGMQRCEIAVRVAATKGEGAFTLLERMELDPVPGEARRLLERVHPVRLDAAAGGGIEVQLTPLNGQALLCGAVVEPVEIR